MGNTDSTGKKHKVDCGSGDVNINTGFLGGDQGGCWNTDSTGKKHKVDCSSFKIINGGSHECHMVYSEFDCKYKHAAKCKWEITFSSFGICTKRIDRNQRECNIEHNKYTQCRRRSSHGCTRKKVGKTNTVEECKNICKEREQCRHFIWHKPGNDRWWEEYGCFVLEGFKWFPLGNRDVSRKKDRNTISGTCKKGSKCIEANTDYHGNDIDRLEYIQSAQDCACECKNNWRCKYFSWVESKKLCWLKTAIGGITSMGADGSINVRGNDIYGINIGQTGGNHNHGTVMGQIGGNHITGSNNHIFNNGQTGGIKIGGVTHTMGRGRTQQYGVYSGSEDCCKGWTGVGKGFGTRFGGNVAHGNDYRLM